MTFRELLEILRRRAERVTMVVEGTDNTVDCYLYRATRNIRPSGIVYCHGGTLDVSETTLNRLSDAKNYSLMGYHTLIVKFPDEDHPDIIQPNPNLDVPEVRDAAALLKLLTGVSAVDLIGVSRGGFVSLLSMAYHPESFRKCVAMIPPIDSENKEWMASQHDWAVKYLMQTRSPMALAREGKYKGIENRICTIGGKDDPVCPPNLHSEKFGELINCKHFVVKDAKHDVQRTSEGQALAMQFLGGRI